MPRDKYQRACILNLTPRISPLNIKRAGYFYNFATDNRTMLAPFKIQS